MSQNDNAVLTAALGYVFVGSPGLAPPTPAELKTLDPLTFGSQVQKLKIVGTSGTFSITSGTDTAGPLPYNPSVGALQVALESLDGVGAGNTVVTALSTPGEFSVATTGSLQGKPLPAMTFDVTNLVGTGKAVTLEVTTAPNGWGNIGHTSREDMPEFGFDGGDSEVKGTWQNPALREVVTEQAADYLTLQLNQFDEQGFTLYYGSRSAASANTPGVFGVDGSTQTYERSFLVIIIDGTFRLGFTAAKASVRRDDAISLPVDEFGAMPIKATFLKLGNRDKFQWINEDLFS